MAPVWFVVIGVILLILYIIFRVIIGGSIFDLIALLTGKISGCGCLLSTIGGILAAIALIVYLLSELSELL